MAVCAAVAIGDPRATLASAEGDKDSRTRLCTGLALSSRSIRSLTDMDSGAVCNFALVLAGLSKSRAEQVFQVTANYGLKCHTR